jgi:putative transposase
VGAEISTTSIRRILAVRRRHATPPRDRSPVHANPGGFDHRLDLFTVESVRLKTLHVLFFIDLHPRRVLIGDVTDGAASATWCAQIARNLTEAREDRDHQIRFLVHDGDKRFSPTFDEVFRPGGIEILQTSLRAPSANAFAERFIRTLRTECLDRMLILGVRHLRSALEISVEHCNGERPHRGLHLGPPAEPRDVTRLRIYDSVARRHCLGGLIHGYHRRAARTTPVEASHASAVLDTSGACGQSRPGISRRPQAAAMRGSVTILASPQAQFGCRS